MHTVVTFEYIRTSFLLIRPQSYGIFQAYYSDILIPESSPSKIAWIGSLQIFLLFASSILVSPLLDKGYFHFCLSGGSLLLVLGVVTTSFCKEWWQLFLAQGLMTGLGMGLMFGSGVVVLMTYFDKHLATATGIAAAGGSIGGIIYSLVVKELLFKIGFPWTIRGTLARDPL